MKRVDLIRAIEGFGCQFVRHGAKHDWYFNPTLAYRSPFPGIGKSRIIWHVISSRCSAPAENDQ
jgi:hypothetical protein